MLIYQAYYYNCIYGPQIFIGSTCNNFCLFNICYQNKNVYAYVILCRLNTSSGGSRGASKKCSLQYNLTKY